MKNEVYLRVSHDEQVPGRRDNGEDGDEDSSNHPFSTWRKQPFQSLRQDDETQDLAFDNTDSDALDNQEDNDEKTGKQQATIAPSLETTTPALIISPASSHHGSEGFFDDDIDALSRYQLDFSDTSMERNVRESMTLEEAVAQGHLTCTLLQHAYQQTQEETRRHRVDQLLSATRESEKLWITASSWCDLYDRGLGVLVLVTGLWLGLATVLKQRLLTLIGALYFILRISAKPLYWYLRGRHLARRRKVNMQMYEQVNQLGMELTPNKEMNLVHDDDGDDHDSHESPLSSAAFVTTVQL